MLRFYKESAMSRSSLRALVLVFAGLALIACKERNDPVKPTVAVVVVG